MPQPQLAAAPVGRVNSCQSMGAVDGPGLRYVVFLQGCPLRCAYCHNPDTWEFGGGEETTVESLLQKIRRCAPYIKKEGGVTVTGGEPLAQSEFVAALFAALRAEGFHTALDTAGAGSLAAARAVLAHTDFLLADLKFTTEEEYRRCAGGSLAHTLEFLDLAREMGVPLWLRHVVVPGLTDDAQHAARFAALCWRYENLQRVELLPFRKLCLEKYRAMGIPFLLEDTPEAGPEHLRALRAALGKLAAPTS
ncbi:pyruvate formate-lyase-activating protein [Allofournierella sp.]|uniref:pyruvate formate-lyase-activating protein n=1 Tax=Allofournierella sp. TaxID=1940256 RepID=UPI003AB3E71E